MTSKSSPKPKAADLRTSRLIQTGLEVVALEGINALTLNSVSKRSGFSKHPALDRFSDVGELHTQIWQELIAPELLEQIADLFVALNLADESESLQTCIQICRNLQVANLKNRAAAEILVQSCFDENLRLQIQNDLDKRIGREFLEPSSSVTLESSTKNSYAFILAIAMILSSKPPIDTPMESDFPLEVKIRALRDVVEITALPPIRSVVHDEIPDLLDENPRISDLFKSCLSVVGEVGFEKASTKAISNRADVSEGFLYSNFKNKQDLFSAASARFLHFHMESSQSLREWCTDNFGDDVAEAVFIREEQYPGRELYRRIGLEQIRISWHSPEVRTQRIAEFENFYPTYELNSKDIPKEHRRSMFFLDIAFGAAVPLAPFLVPEIWRTNYRAVSNSIYKITSQYAQK